MNVDKSQTERALEYRRKRSEKCHLLQLWVDKDDMLRIKAAAKKVGLTGAAFVRMHALEAVEAVNAKGVSDE